MKLNDIIIVNIEKLTYEGLGLARYGEDKFVVFVKNSLPLEVLKVKITSLNKTYAKADIIEILTPSAHRIKPFCPIYNACGSCNIQICDYDYLIELKTDILKDIFKDIVSVDLIKPVLKSSEASQNPLKYRHKIQYPVRQTKNSKRVLIGYYKENSHDLTNIKFCPIQDDVVNKIAQYIRENYILSCYNENKNKGLLKHLVIRLNSKNNEMLLSLVLNSSEDEYIKNYKNYFEEFFKLISAKFEIIKGCFINFNTKKQNKILGDTTIKILGCDYIKEYLKDKIYKITPESFFQVNPKGAEVLFDIVRENIEKNSTILDAYGGVGAIGIYVSNNASKITLVEENKSASAVAKENYELNNIKNYEIFQGDVKNHFKNFLNENKTFDYVILDPPRSGCDIEALNYISKMTKNIIYVSCNPQTQRRDMMYLINVGFKVKSIQGVDMFPYTYHIESVAVFKKE